jgi:hypothetical protein
MTTPHDEHTAEQVEETTAPGPGSVGDARLDEAVARLDDLRERPVGDHVEVYDDIHARLRGALEEAAVDPASPQSH